MALFATGSRGSTQRTGLVTECLHLGPDSITHSFVTEGKYLSILSQIIYLYNGNNN